MNSNTLPAISTEFGLQRYMEEIKRFPVLSQNDEYDMAVRWHKDGDMAAAHGLVTAHLRLVAKMAMQFRGYGLPLMDIISEGNIGLMTAVKKFNPYMGYRLATYAMWWIKATIQDYILKSWSAVKMGTSNMRKKLFFNLRKVRQKLLHANSVSVLPNESEMIANELQVSKFDVEAFSRGWEESNLSLNHEMYGEEGEVIDIIAEPSDDQETALVARDEHAHKERRFKAALGVLSSREREVIAERHLRDKPVTLEDLAQRFTVSAERIRQIEATAVKKLMVHVRSSEV